MNASIQGIIDHLFKDTVVNAETRALHEELLNNCMEHYDDLIGRGMSETEAIDAVVDSLKGMKEVIDEYPKKPGSERETFSADNHLEAPESSAAEPEKQSSEQKKPAEYTYEAAPVRRIQTDLKNCDLQISVSPDERIHVRCEDMDQLICEMDGSTLSIHIADGVKQINAESGKEMNSPELTLKGVLGFLAKVIGTAASSITVSWNIYIDLPASFSAEFDLNAKSGNIKYNAGTPERLNLHTMSGDADVRLIGGGSAEKAVLSSMSGDVEFDGNAKAIVMSSMSGDVTARGKYQDAELKSTSGDVLMTGSAEYLHLVSVSGDATAEMNNRDIRMIEARTTSGDVNLSLLPETDSVHAVVSTVSGSASCRFADSGEDALLHITAKSVSGDVIIR